MNYMVKLHKVPLNSGLQIYYQQDGAPTHLAAQINQYLDKKYRDVGLVTVVLIVSLQKLYGACSNEGNNRRSNST